MKQEIRKSATFNLCIIALSVALITVCSWISIPVSETVKYSLQLVAVFVCAGLFGVWRGLAAAAIYTLMGLIGIPVFASFAAGPNATTGFVIGFLPLALVVGCIRLTHFKHVWTKYLVWGGMMLSGLLLCYAVGTVWFMAWTKYDFFTAIGYTILPYYLFDLDKIVLSLVLVERLQRFVP